MKTKLSIGSSNPRSTGARWVSITINQHTKNGEMWLKHKLDDAAAEHVQHQIQQARNVLAGRDPDVTHDDLISSLVDALGDLMDTMGGEPDDENDDQIAAWDQANEALTQAEWFYEDVRMNNNPVPPTIQDQMESKNITKMKLLDADIGQMIDRDQSLGYVQERDVGKYVYLNDWGMSMENDEQKQKREAK